jgi:hypothetical protein
VYKSRSTAAHFPVADHDVSSGFFPNLRRCFAIQALRTGAFGSRRRTLLAIIRSVDVKTARDDGHECVPGFSGDDVPREKNGGKEEAGDNGTDRTKRK